ncbi:RNA polymerase subunit sigma-70 [Streptomyces sp. SAS_272]|uniref:RNA polymerase subunit sigma-70 n=1 Tax=Streptomyces sp. SAS_272 TaxID=3412747 RepID=UPI00403C3D8A
MERTRTGGDGGCRMCGARLPAHERGRRAAYCSAGCRQRAYRERRRPSREDDAATLVADVERRARKMVLDPAAVFRTEVEALTAVVRELRRVARAEVETAAKPVAGDGAAAAGLDHAGQPDRADHAGHSDHADLTEETFAALLASHRRHLHLLCYRMVGSYDDADDLLQETFLRAWRDRASFQHRSATRTWLHRIATNVCLDHLRRTSRRPQRYAPVPGVDSGPGDPPSRLPWLQPYPDRDLDDLLDELPAADQSQAPEAAAVSRETLELVFLAAIQHLPPRQRAVLIYRDVLARPADETARILDMTVAAANGALQRARQTLRDRLPARRTEWAVGERTRQERDIVERYITAAEHADLAMMAELLSADAVLTMPPNAVWFTGREAILAQVAAAFEPASPRYFGRWRFVATAANRMPAVAGYVQRPGTSVYRAHMLDVLRVEAGHIVEITTFETHLVAACGLPLTLAARDSDR